MINENGFSVSRDEVLKKTAQFGLTISVTTLNRYVTSKLITPPERGSRGRGLGTYALYHDGAHIELATVYCMLQRIAPKIGDDSGGTLFVLQKIEAKNIKASRERFVQKYIEKKFDDIWQELLGIYCKDMYPYNILETATEAVYTFNWAELYDEAQYMVEHINPAQIEALKNLTLDAMIYTDPATAIYPIYQAIFIRFAAWDWCINKKIK